MTAAHPEEQKVSDEIAVELGLTKTEYEQILSILQRKPNYTELCIFSAMWSEHCSYKSSKKWLKTLPTSAPWVICGPGENAGVVDLGEGLAAVFKMESHNHPSFIDPYQGAATGVGGILRDVFTMGARPIANLNVLRFGSPRHEKTQYLLRGVVAGIGGYGNCVGIPTVGGECDFNKSFNGNILVNAMSVGIVPKDKIFYAKATGIGNPVIYVGSKTGRDGIHGATMASSEFSESSVEKRPTVQVGDPFTEKLLLEACLELMEKDVIVAIQDMGAAGLTSSAFEMASKGNLGIELHLDKVPQRERDMAAYELMLSESQERMLVVIKAGSEAIAKGIFAKWELPFAIIGSLTNTGHMTLHKDAKMVADLPIAPLVKEAPEYDRPWKLPAAPLSFDSSTLKPKEMSKTLLELIGSPHLCSRRWIWEQYDNMVMGDTISKPGGDAAIVRIHGTRRALAVTTDCTPRYVAANPRIGGMQAVAEAWRNLSAVGARPLAVTDCLNFGNPERPEIMGQFVESIKGIGTACRALNFPVVSGNVSLYNETTGVAVQPTPEIGGVGIVDDIEQIANIKWTEGDEILLVGKNRGHLANSLYAQFIHDRHEGEPPPVDLTAEKRNGEFIQEEIRKWSLRTCHDIADGGLLVAIAEMAIASRIGAEIEEMQGDPPSWWFAEDQARYLIGTHPSNVTAMKQRADNAGVPLLRIGTAKGNSLTINGLMNITVYDLTKQHENWLPSYMELL